MFHSGVAAFAALSSLALSLPLQADLKIHIREASGATVTSHVDYYKEKLWRRDSQAGDWFAIDSANRRTINVDPVLRQYTVHTFPSTPPVTDPDQTFVI